ncbi:IS91 family transposase, partial [Anaerovorax odorimutans]|uniref:IS91 family transposase n=1 Tax=Anaerovorax odorimutans TaxID=109327 RepID=UPI000486BAF3
MPEVQDVFQQYGWEYLQNHKLSHVQSKAFLAISKCRTADLGGHTDQCENCGSIRISYNSCRNRHCPKCQTLAKERWIEGQKVNLLNVGYFHIVFTVPSELNIVIYQNQKVCYNILFRTVSETLQELCADKKYLGAKIGFTSILHTWGQNLCFHPHIHCVMAGGGLNKLGKWVNSRKKFLLPIKVLSRKFRGKFLALLKKANLEFFGNSNPFVFNDLLDSCYKKEWIVYCKPPFKTAASVVEYLGRYTHRVAISNNRILSVKNGVVTFKWRDYKDNSKWKIMTIAAEEFIRRFLMHILPQGFMKIRHYG